jgi:hypothetical protein
MTDFFCEAQNASSLESNQVNVYSIVIIPNNCRRSYKRVYTTALNMLLLFGELTCLLRKCALQRETQATFPAWLHFIPVDAFSDIRRSLIGIARRVTDIEMSLAVINFVMVRQKDTPRGVLL